MSLRYDQVAELIKIIDASACDDFVLETAELKLSLRRRGAGDAALSARPAEPARQAAVAQAPASGEPSPAAPPGAPAAAGGAGREMRAPMVGTFYRAPSPEAPPFVDLGDRVTVGQPLCVIEVMKLFTTLHAEVAGTIAEIGAANGELVEYGAVLFVIEPEGA
ncbi:acetyl-CoA carboxylase biotin carboxyl carrier protein [Hansschlegelia zhihuaiae]|uniref:Biotin carboxyl carrier protein of acetyl-CoA carboxylase n=1 Tax=Hansschlegelia zhihuaiae TaxID=405005 RepID=A0A4Q0MH31_9HYPH|nr:acetyl-CoA carboxylase biotin carboxyl carrier protein [Hansschlegelia zhihuaiae]RXF72788.1 acetyl-CoA carboxylase biotin carboxyl carrier protein [Hansschlegelia zhihuaiae]